jgi:hypothetical protein
MNTCESYAALLDAFAEGDLFTEDMLQVQKHLNDCPACQAYLDDLFAMRAAFPTIEDTEVPEGFADRVMAAVAAHPRTAAPAEPAPRKKKSPWTKVVLPLAACCAIVVLLQGSPFGSKKETAFYVSYSHEAAKAEEAAPTAEAPAAALEDSVALAEEVVASKSIHAPAAGQTEPVEEPKTAPTADAYLEDNDRSINEPVYLYAAELPAESAELLKDYTPADETADAVYYHLSAVEYAQLESRLADAGISYLAKEGIDPTTDLVLVVLSK